MSDWKVELCEVESVTKHPNADRLDIVTLKDKGWQTIVSKGNFAVGDLCLYFPIDTVFTGNVLESLIFGPDAKVKLNKGRVKTIKLRGEISQGLIVDPLDVLDWEYLQETGKCKPGYDCTEFLDVEKYEPPEDNRGLLSLGHNPSGKSNPNFEKFNDIPNFKNCSRMFKDEDFIVATEKIHGTNARCGWVPTVANSKWKKIKKFFGLLPKYEWCIGSRNRQLSDNIFSKKGVYAEVYERYDFKNILPKGYVIYGEIYGDKVQKNYTYGCGQGEQEFIAFDLKINGEWMDYSSFVNFCMNYDIPYAPREFVGFFKDFKIQAKSLVKGPSKLAPTQLVKEGIVIKNYSGQRKVAKFINDDYLMDVDNTTEYH